MKYLVLIFVFGIFTVNCESGEKPIEEIQFERPKLDYTRVLYNCIDRIMHVSDDYEMKNFYININSNLRAFLKLVRANEVSLSEFQQTAKSLREDYLLFKKKYTKAAKKCANWMSYINLNLIVNCTENILGFMSDLEQQQYRALGSVDVLDCLTNNFNKILACTEKNIKRIYVPVYRPKDDPEKSRPAREQHKKKKVDLPFSSRCGTSMQEMIECSEEAFYPCTFHGRESAVNLVKSLTKYSELEMPECYDLNTFLTFDVITTKLRRMSP